MKKMINLFPQKIKIETISHYDIIGDKVTKQQKATWKNNTMWHDQDKDNVINGLDCAPKNKKKHQISHTLKDQQEAAYYLQNR